MSEGKSADSRGLLIIVALFGAAALIFGKIASNPSNGNSSDAYIKDAAGILSESTKQVILDANDGLEEDYGGAQLVVATVKSLDGEHIRIYSKQFFKLNNIGSQKNQNGMLLLVSVEDKDYYAMYGNGLSDLLAGDVAVALDTYMKDDFLNGDYDKAIAKAVPALAQVLKDGCAQWHGGSASSGGTTSQVTQTDHASGESAVSTASLGLGYLIKRLAKILIGGALVVIIGLVAIVILIVFVFRSLMDKERGGTYDPERKYAVHKSSDPDKKITVHRSSDKLKK